MNKSDIRKKCENFIYSTGMKRVDYGSLSDALEKCGYTVILFKKSGNELDVQTLITGLHLEEQIQNSKGFTVANNDYKLIFLLDGLEKKDSLMVLAHETGHIVLGHMKNNYVVGADVQEEFDANTFASMLVDRPLGLKIALLLKKYRWEAMMAAAVAVVLLITVFAVKGLRALRLADAQKQVNQASENLNIGSTEGAAKSMSDLKSDDAGLSNDAVSHEESADTTEQIEETKETETAVEITSEATTEEETSEKVTAENTEFPEKTKTDHVTTEARETVIVYVDETVTAENPYSNFLVVGTSGDVTFTLDKNGVLTFSGTGSMKDEETQIGVYHEDNYNSAQFAFLKNIFSGDNLDNTVVEAPYWRDCFDPALVNTVIVGEGITEIPRGAFAGMNNLTSVSLPSTLNVMGQSAFEGCIGLKSIDVPAGVTVIQKDTFRGCYNLTDITLHDGLKKIESGAFSYLYWTTDEYRTYVTFNMPNTVVSFTAGAFEGNGQFAMIVSDKLESAGQSNYLYDAGGNWYYVMYYVKQSSTAEQIIAKWCLLSNYSWISSFRYKGEEYSGYDDCEDKYYW